MKRFDDWWDLVIYQQNNYPNNKYSNYSSLDRDKAEKAFRGGVGAAEEHLKDRIDEIFDEIFDNLYEGYE